MLDPPLIVTPFYKARLKQQNQYGSVCNPRSEFFCGCVTDSLCESVVTYVYVQERSDRKAAILYEYETFKSNEGEQLLDTYLRYLQVINDLKKCGYKKDNCELNYKFLNNLEPEWKQYGTLMRQTKNLMDINIDALYNILKQNQGDVNDALGYKKKAVMITSDPLALVAEKTNVNKRKEKSANKKQEFVKSNEKKEEKNADEKKRNMSKVKCYNCKKVGHFSKDCKKAKEINANKVFMAQIEKVLSESDESSSSAEETIAEVAYYTSESESESEFETSEYYDNSTNYGLFVNNDDDQEIFHDAIEFASENFIKKHIDSQKDYDKSEVDHNDSEEKEHLVDKLIRKFNHKIAKCQKREKNNEFHEQIKVLNENNADLLAQTKVLKDQLQVKHVVIDTHVECYEKYAKFEEERYEYMIRYSALFDNDKQHREQIADQEVLFDKMSVELVELDKHDILYNGRKGIGFENPRYFEKAKDLRPSLHDEKVIGLGYTLMFLTHSDEALEIKKFKRSRENKIEFAYDYGNLNASYVNEKINFEDDYFQEIINPYFKKINSPFQQTSSLKLYVSNVILEKIIIDLKDEVVSLLEKEKENLKTIESLKSKMVLSQVKMQFSNRKIKVKMIVLRLKKNVTKWRIQRKRRKRKSSKQNDKQVDNDVSRANSDFVYFLDLDTFSSVRRPKNSGVIWKKKGPSNTSKVDLSAVSLSKLNKNVKRYSRKDLLPCNNSHLGETRSAYVCNDAMNVSCISRMCDVLDDNNFFIFDDESVRISPVSKMPFRKKPCDSMNQNQGDVNDALGYKKKAVAVHSDPFALVNEKMNIVQIYLWIIDSGCSKHMPGNRALLTNFMEKFLGTVRFGNNDFAVIVGYGDVVIGSMTIKKVYYVKGLGHNLFSVGQFCDKGLEAAFRKSTRFVRKEDVVFDDYSRYTWVFFLHSKDEASEAEAITTAFFTQNCSIIYKHFDKTPYELMNKRKLNIKFFHVFGCRCYLLNDYEDVGKIKVKGDIKMFIGYSKDFTAFRIYNKRTRKIHESVNVNFDEILKMTTKQFSLELGLSNLNETGKSSNPSVSQVSETSKKDLEDLFHNFYDEYFDSSKLKKSLTMNVKTFNIEIPSNEEVVFHKSSESFQEESSSSSLNDDFNKV
nr:copia protein [Tanacetum cinerariifolium]